MADDEEEEEVFGKWDGSRDEASGAPHGFGTATFPNGDVYVGEMEQGTRQGQGTYTFKEGKTVYTGGYVNNKKHGMGKVVYTDGSVYEGDWSKGQREGKGVCKYANGDVYTGGWRSGKKSGQGEYLSKSGDCKFIGDWENGQFKQGEWAFNGGSYKGKFAFGQPAEGEGTFFFTNGNVQSGKWIPMPKGDDDEDAGGGDDEEGESVPKPPKLQWIVE